MAFFKSKEMRAFNFHLDGMGFGIGVITDRKILEEGIVELSVVARRAVKAGHREEVTKKLAQARTWPISGPENKGKAWLKVLDSVENVVSATP